MFYGVTSHGEEVNLNLLQALFSYFSKNSALYWYGGWKK